jgi:hypothetical protein
MMPYSDTERGGIDRWISIEDGMNGMEEHRQSANSCKQAASISAVRIHTSDLFGATRTSGQG